MNSKTHSKFSITFALIGTLVLQLEVFNYYIAVVMLVIFSLIGAIYPDLDHGWHSVKHKNGLTWIINKILKITGAKHRSRHTHSWDVAIISGVLSYLIIHRLYDNYIINLLDLELMTLMLVGFYLGWFSHLFGDMLTSEGVRVTCLSNDIKIKLVPKSLFGFKFNTGGEWERFCNKMIGYINNLLALVVIVYPYIERIR